jgi:Protein of unknown function (DUF2493).
MKVLVCGSRHFNDYEKMKEILDDIDITTIIEGEARGADQLSRIYAEHRGIPVERFPADWNKFGLAAGPIRNTAMLTEGKPDYVVAFRGQNSRGTQNMIDQATKAGIEVRIIEI